MAASYADDSPVVNIEIQRKSAYIWCCGKKISKRKVRTIAGVTCLVAATAIITYRAVDEGTSVPEVLAEVGLLALGVLTPSW